MPWTLVTGGAKRLGAEICRKLASRGYDIVVHYNAGSMAAQEVADFCLKQGVKAETIRGNFSTQESTLQFAGEYLAKFPDTKNLINNVGNYLIGSPLQTPLAQWYDLFQTNLHTPIILIRDLIPSIMQNKGAIINIGTVGVNGVAADTYSTAYRCTKLSLWMLTKSLAKELASSSVKVNMISPGYLENAVDLPKDPADLPMGRPARLSEVADIVEFLLSPHGEYITGQNIEVAGGVKL